MSCSNKQRTDEIWGPSASMRLRRFARSGSVNLRRPTSIKNILQASCAICFLLSLNMEVKSLEGGGNRRKRFSTGSPASSWYSTLLFSPRTRNRMVLVAGLTAQSMLFLHWTSR